MYRHAFLIAKTCMPLLVAALLATGCATTKSMKAGDETTRAALSHQIEDVGSTVEQLQTDVTELGGTVERQGAEIESLSATAREALERATAAGKLLEGKFLYETVLADDRVRFSFEQAALGDDAQAALDDFALEVLERDESVFIEIQGHTDSSGDEIYNFTLGEKRAENVRRYLSLEHGLPLHRMAVISYGETVPISDNTSRDGRAQNRRVSLVVLQ